MTKRDKIIILFASILAILVIASIIFQRTYDGTKGQSSPILLTIGLIVVSLLSVVFVYVRFVRKSRYEKRLHPEYYETYQGIKDSLAHSNLPLTDKREAISDILELLISAQENGKAVSDVIPNGTEFAYKVIQAYMKNGRKWVLLLLDGCVAFFGFILLTQTLLWLEQPLQNYFLQKIDNSLLLFFAVIAFVVLPFIKWCSAKQSYWAYMLPLLSGITLIGLMEALRYFFYESALVKILLDGSVPMIPSISVLGGYILLATLLFLGRRMIRRRSI